MAHSTGIGRTIYVYLSLETITKLYPEEALTSPRCIQHRFIQCLSNGYLTDRPDIKYIFYMHIIDNTNTVKSYLIE